mmetsp:Transcript_25351/g.50885  ORF Transcript_25351/g.50885 Transcript_25351/m.50885 type:complete len:372 (-) Transcript_25351:142-1257(-)
MEAVSKLSELCPLSRRPDTEPPRPPPLEWLTSSPLEVRPSSPSRFFAFSRLFSSTSTEWNDIMTSQSRFLMISRKVSKSPRMSGGMLSYAITKRFKCFIISAHRLSATFSSRSGSKSQWLLRPSFALWPAASVMICFANKCASLNTFTHIWRSLQVMTTCVKALSSDGTSLNTSPLRYAKMSLSSSEMWSVSSLRRCSSPSYCSESASGSRSSSWDSMSSASSMNLCACDARWMLSALGFSISSSRSAILFSSSMSRFMSPPASCDALMVLTFSSASLSSFSRRSRSSCSDLSAECFLSRSNRRALACSSELDPFPSLLLPAPPNVAPSPSVLLPVRCLSSLSRKAAFAACAFAVCAFSCSPRTFTWAFSS